MTEYGAHLPQETVDRLQIDTSVIPSPEVKKVRSLATLVSQTINSEYQEYIPQGTMERNFDLGQRVVVADDLSSFAGKIGYRHVLPASGTGVSFGPPRVIAILNPEIDWGRCCPHCGVKDSAMEMSQDSMREVYKGRYYTTLIAHEELHQYQDYRLPLEFLETAVYYYTSIIARKLGHDPLGDEIAAMRYDAYERLLNKYGQDVHRVFFGSANSLPARLKKTIILQEVKKQKEALFPNGQDF